MRAEVLCELFGLSPVDRTDAGDAGDAGDANDGSGAARERQPALDRDMTEPMPSERKAVT
jgi:hypothetical protein